MSDIAVKVSAPIALRARLNEDWLAVVIGLLVFGSALVSISGTDLLGWAVTTSVYTDLAKALNPFAKAYAWLGGGGALLATYAALLVVLSVGVVTLGADVRKFALAFTAVFAIAYASWILGSYPGRAAEVRSRLVAQADQRGRLHRGPAVGTGHRQFLSPVRGLAKGRDTARALHQDRDRHSRRHRCGHRGGPVEPRIFSPFARRCGDRRGVSDLLGRDLLHRAQMVWLQPRMVGAAGVRHFDLRRGGGDR